MKNIFQWTFRGRVRLSSRIAERYDADESIRFAFHAHSPDIWNFAERLGIPITDKKVEYGTPEMAEEVFSLFRETNVKDLGIFAMGGHTDGIFSFGETAQRAGEVLFYYLFGRRGYIIHNSGSLSLIIHRIHQLISGISFF